MFSVKQYLTNCFSKVSHFTAGAQCVKKPPKPPTPPRQIVTTQPTTATTAATTTTAAPTTAKPSGKARCKQPW